MEISKHITEKKPLEGLQLLSLPTGLKEMVLIGGSILGGSVYSPSRNPFIATVTARMLEESTKRHKKEEIRNKLESVGATVSFSSDAYRVRFNGMCLKKDASLLLEIISEQIREPLFDTLELENIKKRMVAGLEQELEDTGSQAEIKFLQILYPKGHPNYRHDSKTAINYIKKITKEDIVAYHRHAYGLGSMIVTAAGDFDNKIVSNQLGRVFSGWKVSPLKPFSPKERAFAHGEREDFVVIPDKSNVDLCMGGTVGINNKHEDYHALLMGVFVLGGTFFARLMNVIREKKGLTYSVRASLAGMDCETGGYWAVRGIFGPSLLSPGKTAVRTELKKWVEKGITDKELRTFKETINGLYKVGLDTTSGLAKAILLNAEQGRKKDYLDKYVEIMNRLSLKEVNKAIKTHIDLNSLVSVSAGTIDKKGNPF
jgi:zinc protease